ncbi:MAG: rRNA pseudouridine synthase [Chitinophagaceae bacterium]|nr:rRNA pseudouridine synthase [Chitinophagaceae bacterium]MCA6493880.1 rRNA pseudouridine synthase [Chitinophagaceae bacterium]MCA6499644.1 rRNA pseudouridine synthase [Chitinophagaceae bacterium]MCA6515465.1 rRNA pseudouridine synthase [Chitinophagaceae bacterium]
MKKRTDNFSRFSRQTKGSVIKEAYRQEKRKNKAAARAEGEAFRKKKVEKEQGVPFRSAEKETRPYNKRKEISGPRPRKNFAPKTERTPTAKPTPYRMSGEMPLNKYVAHCGICGRREAAELIKQGKVSVNGVVVNEPGHKVSGKEKIKFEGKPLQLQVESVYILLNKPKDYLTTTRDPAGRKTVLELLKNATKERIYPVGRLDRNTTGVLLLTNDGELAQQLTHPSFEVKKIYEAILDKPVASKDLEQLLSGLQLEDGFIRADAAGYSDTQDKTKIGIEIHSGRNRIVRRMFEFLGYQVKSLDRVMFANLTKKNVDRGKWRFLQEKEVRNLKYMNQSFIRKTASGQNTQPAR